MNIFLCIVTCFLVGVNFKLCLSQSIDVAVLAALLNTTLSDTLGDLTAAVTTDRLSEDGKLNFTGLANKYGYESEQHEVITEDGYVLTVFRIPGDTRRPVLLVHGTTPTSDCWIMRGKTSLAAALADQGYDVWAINLRGSRYSRRNLYIDPDREPRKFFNLTFYEQGVSDVPHTIDYVLNVTRQTQLITIAHSSGTTSTLIMGAELPEYNAKVKLFIALAPIVYLKNTRGLATLGEVLNQLGIFPLINNGEGYELFSHQRFGPLLQAICLGSDASKEICRTLLFSIAGFDPAGFEIDYLPTFLGHYPGGTTTKTVQYALQLRENDRLAKFDYGPAENLERYGSVVPPAIELGRVRMRTALVAGRGDFLSAPPDAARLAGQLPNLAEFLVLPYRQFNHVDFVYGNNMTEQLFPYIFDLLNTYV